VSDYFYASAALPRGKGLPPDPVDAIAKTEILAVPETELWPSLYWLSYLGSRILILIMIFYDVSQSTFTEFLLHVSSYFGLC
jgi:hypothetical protein